MFIDTLKGALGLQGAEAQCPSGQRLPSPGFSVGTLWR